MRGGTAVSCEILDVEMGLWKVAANSERQAQVSVAREVGMNYLSVLVPKVAMRLVLMILVRSRRRAGVSQKMVMELEEVIGEGFLKSEYYQ